MIKWVIVIALSISGEEFWIESHHAPLGQFSHFESKQECDDNLKMMQKEILNDFIDTFDFVVSFEPPRCVAKDIILRRFPDKPDMKPMIGQREERDV